MIWLKHMILAVVVAVMTAAPVMSCCTPGHSSASVKSERVDNAQGDHHTRQDMRAMDHPCEESSNITDEHHSGNSKDNDSACNGCSDCTFMATQANVHYTAVQIKVDHEPEQVIQALAFETTAQPPIIAKFIKPPATAPPFVLTPIYLKQILIV
jgi:hypothetical protein